ncbi:hypothetical protein VHEMI02583 [[Torrubiella] hemipterigena]|uniref:C2H2-type domain-containing protein n=1 Tax=[Torrubiella] hemipterigena TaxID=1531966 RepID=A0A0A1SQ13_9HYPO|nr:hypothetical protein VHEMI02583 [[Torrubiella] hemipterigena]
MTSRPSSFAKYKLLSSPQTSWITARLVRFDLVHQSIPPSKKDTLIRGNAHSLRMTSSTFLPSYDPALLEPLGSPCMPDASASSDSDFLFPHNAYEDSLSSCLSASQSPSYSPKCSSIDSDSYHLPSPRRISQAASKPRSLKVESSKRKSASASSPRLSPYGRSKASKNASPERNDVSGTWDCAHCSLPFRDLPSLDKHVKSEHTRPLICVFHWAGCTSRFASKNEWKRHVFSQHLALRYWLCTEGTCGHSRSSTNARRRSSSLPAVGCIFNRKDLYTQHLRRMHVQGDGGKKSTKKSKDSSTEDFIREMQTRAARIRCELPTFMTCPAENCTIEFHGPNAWDDRMEHVAGHLEHAAVGDEPAVSFGGFGDWTLTGWAEQADVEVVKRTANGWRLCNPLKGDSGSGNGNGGSNKRSSICSSKRGIEEIEDAEGEEDYNQWPYPAPAIAQ